MQEETIAALATGVDGSIAIVRLSGAAATAVGDRLWRGRRPLGELPPRTMVLGRLVDAPGATIDRCLALRMPAPCSYTGEDVVEFHCHGGPLVGHQALAALLAAGARLAAPGEFTRRAFINGKLDLTQAEAVLDVIQAQSTMALHAANRQLAGLLGRRVNAAHEAVLALLAEVESRLDFVDEALDFAPNEVLAAKLDAGLAEVDSLLRSRTDGEILRHGIRLVIAGAPNAGKSSLLNLLLGRDRAIVTEIPGTTRDTLEEPAHLRGIPVNLVDTAGIREATDVIERHGIDRSYRSIAQAQLVLWLIDLTRELSGQLPPTEHLAGKSLIVVANKIDLAPAVALALPGEPVVVRLCARTGDGLEALLDAIERQVWGRPHASEPEIAINARHAAELAIARQQLAAARMIVTDGEYELLAVNLRAALDALGKVTGRTVQPDVLDSIFSQFCIGK